MWVVHVSRSLPGRRPIVVVLSIYHMVSSAEPSPDRVGGRQVLSLLRKNWSLLLRVKIHYFFLWLWSTLTPRRNLCNSFTRSKASLNSPSRVLISVRTSRAGTLWRIVKYRAAKECHNVTFSSVSLYFPNISPGFTDCAGKPTKNVVCCSFTTSVIMFKCSCQNVERVESMLSYHRCPKVGKLIDHYSLYNHISTTKTYLFYLSYG